MAAMPLFGQKPSAELGDFNNAPPNPILASERLDPYAAQ